MTLANSPSPRAYILVNNKAIPAHMYAKPLFVHNLIWYRILFSFNVFYSAYMEEVSMSFKAIPAHMYAKPVFVHNLIRYRILFCFNVFYSCRHE